MRKIFILQNPSVSETQHVFAFLLSQKWSQVSFPVHFYNYRLQGFFYTGYYDMLGATLRFILHELECKLSWYGFSGGHFLATELQSLPKQYITLDNTPLYFSSNVFLFSLNVFHFLFFILLTSPAARWNPLKNITPKDADRRCHLFNCLSFYSDKFLLPEKEMGSCRWNTNSSEMKINL